MLKGLFGVILAAGLFAAIIFLLLHFIGFIALFIPFFAAGLIIASIIAFVFLFILGFVLFFALFYFLFEKKPTIQKQGNYTLSMEKGKGEEKKK